MLNILRPIANFNNILPNGIFKQLPLKYFVDKNILGMQIAVGHRAYSDRKSTITLILYEYSLNTSSLQVENQKIFLKFWFFFSFFNVCFCLQLSTFLQMVDVNCFTWPDPVTYPPHTIRISLQVYVGNYVLHFFYFFFLIFISVFLLFK